MFKMSKERLRDSWKTEKFRKSVVDKLHEELEGYKLKQENLCQNIENAIYEKSQTKRQYLGYVAKIILNVRNMVCVQDEWLQNYVKEVLSKLPPRLRKVLRPEELARYNREVMRLRCKMKEDMKNKQ